MNRAQESAATNPRITPGSRENLANIMLRGRRALVVGLLNKHSLAAGAARALLAQGARVLVASRRALSPAQRLACGLEPHNSGLDPSEGAPLGFAECDVEDAASVEALAARCQEELGGLDVLVHSVAFAPPEAFAGGPRPLMETSREAWATAMGVSAYSLVALTRAAHPLLAAGGGDKSVVAMTYAGSSRVMPGYNVMGPAKAALEAAARQLAFELGPDGIRVNCVSPGPMNTVSARGIPGISVRLRGLSGA